MLRRMAQGLPEIVAMVIQSLDAPESLKHIKSNWNLMLIPIIKFHQYQSFVGIWCWNILDLQFFGVFR